MKVYIKIHKQANQSCIGACDEECLGRTLKSDCLKFNVSHQFFEGRIYSLQDAVEILKKSTNYNIVGVNICNALIDAGVLHKEGIKEIEGIPIAIKFSL